MTVSRYYSSVAKRTTLTADAGSSATSMVIAAATGFPSLYPYTMIVDEDTVNEELVTVSARSGTTLTVVRAVDGSAAVAHTAGASVRHGVSARDFADSRSHEDASEAVHGLGAGSAVVGRIDAQTLTNKTLTAPVINAATVTGTVSGGTFSGSTLTSATLGSALAAGSFKITGLADPTSAQDAVTKVYADIITSAAAASAATATAGAASATASAATATTQAASASSSAAAAASALDSFDDRYLGPFSSQPTLDNDGNSLLQGALFYLNTGAVEVKGMYVYDGAYWIKASAAASISFVLYEYTATASQTVFSGADINSLSMAFTTGLQQVFLNGVLLNPGDDYTAASNAVTLVSGAAVGDSLTVVAFSSFNVANTYTQAQVDALIANTYTQTQVNNIIAAAAPFKDVFLMMGA